ncbi:MAG TPA: STAS domain-containing protein [Acidimicrobiia bacterium]|nr:STAS domain-containing protein [Acidimicrobiia bacterium]
MVARSSIAQRGDLDAASAPTLSNVINDLLAANVDEIVLDMSDNWFCDSAGLRVILDAHEQLTRRGGRLVLRSPTEPVMRLLEVTGLRGHLNVEP